MERLAAVVDLCDEPAVAARLRERLGLGPDEDLVLQFADSEDGLPSPLREIHRAMTAQGEDREVLDDLRAFLLHG